MTYEEARAYLQAVSKRGIVLGLDSVRALLGKLGHPERDLRFLHIAGTNGKGSVAAFCSSVLRQCGYRVGTYTSPEVFCYEERFSVNCEPMDRQELPRYVAVVKEAAEALAGEGIFPTQFEQETALALYYFRQQGCDIVVLECGLGGREDATNVVENTLVSVITSVALDHTAILGTTLSEIARAKAGIIKPGTVAVTGAREGEAGEVIRREAELRGAALRETNPASLIRLGYEEAPDGTLVQRFSYKGHEDLRISLAGQYQPENGAVAVEALEALAERGFVITEENLRTGLLQAVWPGRFELVSRRPAVVLDGGHNPRGIHALLETAEACFEGRRLWGVMGVLADKDYPEMVRLLCPRFHHIETITPDSPRALSAEALAEEFCRAAEGNGLTVHAGAGVKEALEAVLLQAEPEDAVLVFGSLSFLREAREALAEGEDE